MGSDLGIESLGFKVLGVQEVRDLGFRGVGPVRFRV